MPPHNDPVRFGVIGTGRVAQLHAEAMKRLPGATLSRAWNRNAERVRDFCQAFNCNAAATVEELLDDKALDAVLITTVSGTHYDYAKRALQAGKHVMVEKPISETLEEIQELERIANERGVVCFPSHNYIYAEQMRSLKYAIAAGKLGKTINYWCLFNNQHPPSFGDPDVVMRELMIHHVYSMLHFVGRPQSIVATASNVHFTDPNAPDQVMITATFASGAVANLWGSFATNDDRVRDPWSVIFKFMGDKGAAIISWDAIKYGDEPEPLWDDMSYRDSFLHAQNFFVTECLKNGTAPLSTLADAADALRVLNAARESISNGKRVNLSF